MKKSLVCTSVALLLASTSAVTLAAPISVPNTFTAGTPARAAEVNANFTAVVNGVNANDTKITTNTNNITSNTNRITTNETNIATNTADITALQSAVGAGCPSDMVTVGSLCVDLYEASVWDAATGGNQVTAGAAITRCASDGHDCGDGLATAIYARSVAGVLPNRATWYQAKQACANVGKRLPTTAEWQMAAAGTPPNATDPSEPCNVTGNTLAQTGSIAACVSTAGAFDMVGNLMEWSGDLSVDLPIPASGFISMDDAIAWALGESDAGISGTASTKSVFFPSSGPAAANGEIGFRCVK